jgi:hypothetical protein
MHGVDELVERIMTVGRIRSVHSMHNFIQSELAERNIRNKISFRH